MIADLKPYPAVKDSGVPWLGEVPAHWSTRRLRALARRPIKNGVGESAQGFRKDWPRYVRITDIAGTRSLRERPRASLPPDIAADATLESGDLLFAAVGATYGKSYLHRDDSGPACFAGYLVRVAPNQDVVPEFLSYWTESAYFWDQVNSQVIQATIQNFSAGRVKSLRVPLPPLSEQAAIVRFLDHTDQRIRRYIRAKQKLITLLEEQKQAIILRAVTRGLDPDVRLRPSGVEWIGDMPAHWEVRRNGRLFSQRNETRYADLPILEVSLRTGVRVRDFENLNRKQVMTDRDKYKRAVVGDIAYNLMRMWQGAVGVAPVDGLISPAYVVAKPLHDADSRYFVHLFRTAVYMAEVDKFSRGIAKDRNRLYWADFKRMPSTYPPPREQGEIADAINDKCGQIDASIRRVRVEIGLIREYHVCLITDVVTGKLDVREAAARLPTEVDQTTLPDEVDDFSDAEVATADDLDAVPEEALA